MYIYIYLYIYIEKRTQHSHVLLCSLRSFMFFAKELCVLCVLFCSLEKNGKECIVLSGFISRQKLKKRTEKNVAFFKRTEKNETFRTEKNAVPNPALQSMPMLTPCLRNQQQSLHGVHVFKVMLTLCLRNQQQSLHGVHVFKVMLTLCLLNQQQSLHGVHVDRLC